MAQSPSGIEVSKEEERYLRTAFRRFALPYVLVFALVAWITTTAMSSSDAPAGSPEDVASLHEEFSGLKESITALEGRIARFDSELEKAVNRVGALESRKPPSRAEVPSADTLASLDRSLRDATKRLAELERRGVSTSGPSDERIDALVARIQRIEAARSPTLAPVPASPPPAAPAPAPAPAPGP